MVAHLVRLKLTLLRNGLRRSAWQVVAMIFGVVYGLGALAVVTAGVVALAVSGTPDVRRTVLVVAGSAVLLGWVVLPLAAFGVDATVDPARFVTFPIPRRTLLVGLGLSGLVGVPGAVTALAFAGTALVWWRHPAVVLFALVAAALAVAFFLVASRAVTTALAPVLSGRRSREVTGFVVLVVVAVGYLGFGRLTRVGIGVGDRIITLLGGVARVLGWTPLGAAWAAPADAAAGAWGTAVLRLAVLVATLAVLALLWDRALARALVQPIAHISAGVAGSGLGWFGRVPPGPRGAVLARSLTYWRRDPRYAMAVAAVPLMPLAMWAFGLGDAVLLVLPFLGVIMGWSIASDTSSDGTAFWLHVASPMRGVDDRMGRAVAAGVILGPLVVLLSTFLALVMGRAALLPGLLGATLGAFLTALGSASVMSALVVMRVQQAGENPFGARQGASLAAVLSQMAGMVVVGAMALPEVVLAALSYAWSSPVLGWVGLVVGLVLGALFVVIGVRWGGRLLDRRAPVLLQRLVAAS